MRESRLERERASEREFVSERDEPSLLKYTVCILKMLIEKIYCIKDFDSIDRS